MVDIRLVVLEEMRSGVVGRVLQSFGQTSDGRIKGMATGNAVAVSIELRDVCGGRQRTHVDCRFWIHLIVHI